MHKLIRAIAAAVLPLAACAEEPIIEPPVTAIFVTGSVRAESGVPAAGVPVEVGSYFVGCEGDRVVGASTTTAQDGRFGISVHAPAFHASGCVIVSVAADGVSAITARDSVRFGYLRGAVPTDTVIIDVVIPGS